MRRRRQVCGAEILLAALALAVPASGAGDPVAIDPLRGLVVRFDKSAKLVVYEPDGVFWAPDDVLVYPGFSSPRQGGKSLRLNVVVRSDKGLGLRALRFVIDGNPLVIPLERRDVRRDRSGCRVAEAVLLQGREDLIRKLAFAKEASVEIETARAPVLFQMTDAGLRGFQRLLEAFDAEDLPEPSEGPEPGIENPVLIRSSRVDPVLPEYALERRKEGQIVLLARVLKDGTVGEIKVLNSSALECGFEQSAMAALGQWRYEPGRRNGQPLDVYFTVVMDFSPR